MTESTRKTPLALASLMLLLVLTALFSVAPSVHVIERSGFGIVAVRIDDVQDYYLHDVQIQLLQQCVENGYPLSLGIIAIDFGLDAQLVETMRAAVRAGCEVAVHGWTHEDLTRLTVAEQKVDFLRAKNRLLNTLGIDTSILIPPTYVYSHETLLAMNQAGYRIVSGYIELNSAGMTEENVVSVPATIELSDENGDNWIMKSVENIMEELNASVGSNGYAVLVTHPAEFVQNGIFDVGIFERYCEVLESTRYQFGLTTIQGLKLQVLMGNSAQSLG